MAREAISNCWICGKAVSTDDAGIDEFGLPVHSACQRDYPKKVPSSSLRRLWISTLQKHISLCVFNHAHV
jgi:hypothetical protein